MPRTWAVTAAAALMAVAEVETMMLIESCTPWSTAAAAALALPDDRESGSTVPPEACVARDKAAAAAAATRVRAVCGGGECGAQAETDAARTVDMAEAMADALPPY